jgi:hypothetical protein
MDQALVNAPEAVMLYVEALERAGRDPPPPRTLSQLKDDARFVEEARDNLIAIVHLPGTAAAAE